MKNGPPPGGPFLSDVGKCGRSLASVYSHQHRICGVMTGPLTRYSVTSQE